MARPKFPSDDVDRLMVRFPPGLKERVAESARENGRSINAELVDIVRSRYPDRVPTPYLVAKAKEILAVIEANEGKPINRFITASLTRLADSAAKEGVFFDGSHKVNIEDLYDYLGLDKADFAAGKYLNPKFVREKRKKPDDSTPRDG